jgi:hypothetical protein
MSTPIGRRPIPRRRVAIAALGLAALFAAVITAGEILRHPYTQASDIPESQLAGSDPRDELECPDPQPREGQRRASDVQPTAPVRVSSNNLFDCPETYDGRDVVYRGEVVGALLERDVGVWTQLNDDVYAELLGPLPAHRDYRGGNAGVGVLLPHHAVDLISLVGGPQTRGDVLEVRGTFHRVDPTGEVAVIRADDAQLMADGEPFPDPPLADRRLAALFALIVAVALVVTERVVAARR